MLRIQHRVCETRKESLIKFTWIVLQKYECVRRRQLQEGDLTAAVWARSEVVTSSLGCFELNR